MRRVWRKTVAVALCAVATTNEPAEAGPSGMAYDVRPIATSSDEGSWTEKLKFWQKDQPATASVVRAEPVKPSDGISPWRNPIQYFSAAMSETPVAESLKNERATPKVKERPDSIALDTPTAPATPSYYIALAQLAEHQGNVVQARFQLQQGLAKWPTDVEILRAAGRMEDRQGQLPLAEKLYQRAVTANPQHAGALNDLGLCLARQGKFAQSVQSIEQAINLQPDKPLYRNNAATVYVEMRQDHRALAHLSAVHEPAVANYNLGQLLVGRGRQHEAIAYFLSAIEIDPTMEPAHAAIAQLQGRPASVSSPVVAERTLPQPVVTPSFGPQLVPQQPVAEPTFPATARGPAPGTSSYVPPAGYYPAATPPSSPLVIAPTYHTATAPRYLPPVNPAVPGTVPPAMMVR